MRADTFTMLFALGIILAFMGLAAVMFFGVVFDTTDEYVSGYNVTKAGKMFPEKPEDLAQGVPIYGRKPSAAKEKFRTVGIMMGFGIGAVGLVLAVVGGLRMNWTSQNS